MQNLDVISVNLWQTLISLANLLVLFLAVKKFLYQPVKKMLAARQSTIEGDYAAASDAKEKALSDQAAYEEKLKGAKKEAESLIQSAVATAGQREQEILASAKEKAEGIVRQAQNEAALEKEKAKEEIRSEIVEVSTLLTEKMLEREVNAEDHRSLIDSFVEKLGEDHDAN